MEIQKILNRLVLTLILLTFISCKEKVDKSVEYNDLQKENSEIIEQVKINQKLLDNWFKDFTAIQEELNKINTNEILLYEYGQIETKPYQQSDKDKLLKKIRKIKSLLDNSENQLKNDYFNISNLKRLVNSLRIEIENKEEIIRKLMLDNQEIKDEKTKISNELDQKSKEANNLQNENNVKENKIIEMYNKITELNNRNKYFLEFTFKDTRISEINGNIIEIKYKLKDIEICSSHPSESYEKIEKDKITIFKILDSNLFWGKTNYLILKINKRHL